MGEAARREAASLLRMADRRMVRRLPCNIRRKPAHVEAAARLRVSHAAGMRKPVEATDALRPTGGGRSAESGPSQLPGGGSDQLPTARRVQRVKRSTSTARPVSSDGSDQLQSLNGCPAGEGLITPTAGLDRGRRAKSTPSFRSALPAKDQRQLRSGSIPSWATGGERIILRSCPCNRDHAPRVSMVGNLGKSQTVQSLSRPQAPQKRACGAPFEDCRQIVY